MNIFIGFAPWIIFWVLVSNDTFLHAILLAALSTVIISVRQIMRRKIKLLEIGTLVFFLAMTVVAYTADPAWLEKWISVIGNAALLAIALLSILFRKPFTIQYAKEQVEPKFWETPGFISTNYHITWFWCGVFFMQTACSALTIVWPHHETWFTWVLPISAFVAGIKFSGWYPALARERAQKAGQTQTPPA